MLIIRRINCINTTTGICHSVFRAQVGVLHTKRLPTQSDIYQRLYWYNWFPWWWARGCSKRVENWNKYIGTNCASSWSFTKSHNKIQGGQNIKFLKQSSGTRLHCWTEEMIQSTVPTAQGEALLLNYYLCQISCFCECIASTMYELNFSVGWKRFSGNTLTILGAWCGVVVKALRY